MITIAVLSADKNSASLIGGYIRAIEGGEIDFCSVRIFENVIDFFGEYKSGFDIAIIDTAVPGMSGIQVVELIRNSGGELPVILMAVPGMSGIQVVELIRNSGGELPVILISNTIKSAVSAIPYDVSAYLLKPLNEGEFHKALLSAVKRVDGQSGRQLRIRADGTYVLLDIRKLYSVGVKGHYLNYRSEKGEYTCRGTMSECERSLAPYGFVRCNNSQLVNIGYATALSPTEITVADVKHHVSHGRYKKLKEAFLKR